MYVYIYTFYIIGIMNCIVESPSMVGMCGVLS